MLTGPATSLVEPIVWHYAQRSANKLKQCLDSPWMKIPISLQPIIQQAAAYHPTVQQKSPKNFNMILDAIATRIYRIQVTFNLT